MVFELFTLRFFDLDGRGLFGCLFDQFAAGGDATLIVSIESE